MRKDGAPTEVDMSAVAPNKEKYVIAPKLEDVVYGADIVFAKLSNMETFQKYTSELQVKEGSTVNLVQLTHCDINES